MVRDPVLLVSPFRPFCMTVVITLAGCSGPPPFVPPAGHPANAEAPTLPLPHFGATLVVPSAPTTTEQPAAVPHDEAGLYRCPMHSRFAQNGPGRCPICGMSLEKREIPKSGEDGER